MNFVKGAMLGMMAGTIVGVLNSDSLKAMMKKVKVKWRKWRNLTGCSYLLW